MTSDWLTWLLRLTELIALAYVIIIGLYTYGWFFLLKKNQPSGRPFTSTSILIALRNEEAHVESLLDHLSRQTDLPDQCEFIFVDDHSTDQTRSLLEAFAKENSLKKVIVTDSQAEGKKAALATGLSLATGELILVTDADCMPGPRWVSCMVAAYEQSKASLLLGPVHLRADRGLFSQLQALEFMSLIGSTAGSASVGLPSMANGANLAFDRKAIEKTTQLRKDETFASGDDMFLLDAVVRYYGSKAVVFVAHSDAIVPTEPSASLHEFLIQRLRWVSKSKGYSRLAVIFPAVVVLLFNTSLVVFLIASLFEVKLLIPGILFLLLKVFTDYPLLRSVAAFMQNKHLMKWFLPLTLIYPFYVSLVAISGLTANVSWKGRSVRKK